MRSGKLRSSAIAGLSHEALTMVDWHFDGRFDTHLEPLSAAKAHDMHRRAADPNAVAGPQANMQRT